MQLEVDELFPSLCEKKETVCPNCNLAIIYKTGKIIEIMTVLSLLSANEIKQLHCCYSIKAFARAETVERIHSVSNGLQETGMLENKGFICRF